MKYALRWLLLLLLKPQSLQQPWFLQKGVNGAHRFLDVRPMEHHAVCLWRDPKQF